MTVHTDYLYFHTKQRQEIIRITDEVATIVGNSGVREGMVLVSAMHITAGVYVNDWEGGLIEDIQEWLEKLAPARPDYRHHHTGEDNADAHLKRTILGHQVVLPITAGALDLGPWEQVFYAEFDGQRRKRVVVKVMGWCEGRRLICAIRLIWCASGSWRTTAATWPRWAATTARTPRSTTTAAVSKGARASTRPGWRDSRRGDPASRAACAAGSAWSGASRPA